MKIYYPLILILTVLVVFSCKKDDDEKTGESNIDGAPSVVNQEFNIEFIEEQDRIIEKTVKSGVTEISKTTFKFDEDTIEETFYELRVKSMFRKHVMIDDIIQFTTDTVFGPDTIQYFRNIQYFYEGRNMIKMVVEQYNVFPDSINYHTYERDYQYSSDNLSSISYLSGNSNDSLPCIDRYDYYTLTAKHDVHNILGVDEGSGNANLKSQSNHLIGCNGNGTSGSTQYNYWYTLDSDERITELVYQKTFGPSTQAFRENYVYLSR